MCKVLLLLSALTVVYPDGATGQFTAAPPTCPGGTFTFSCTVTGDMSGFTIWRVGGVSECPLIHGSASSTICGPGNSFTARSGAGFGTSGPSFSSTLSGTADPVLNGILVECFGPHNNVDPGNRVDISILKVLGLPSVPTLYCPHLSESISGAVNVKVNWTLSGGDIADFYLINITTNAPQTPYGGVLNITGSVSQYELVGFQAGYKYNITVHGVNCGSLKGRESEPLMNTPQVPATPVSDVCAVYDMVNKDLQIIESTWNEVDDVTVSEDCVNGRGIRASYELNYTTDSGTHITTCVVNATECNNGICHYELRSTTADSRCQPLVSQFSGEDVTVSVTARNIVGRSNSSVSRSISGSNIVDFGVRLDTSNLSSAFVECTLFEPVYNCTIEYGTDPSYTSLVFRDTSSTLGRRATIRLSQRLRGDTTYYYTVSAKSSSQCVKVQGKFRAECTLTDLGNMTRGGTVDPKCRKNGFFNGSSFSDGVVCFNRTTVGSRAVYSCNDNFLLMGNEARVCQRDGNWNGRTPQCISQGSDPTGPIVGGVFGVMLIIIVIIVGVVIAVRNYKKRVEKIRREGEQRVEKIKEAEQGCFFIASGLDENLVMDVAYRRTTPGTQVISYTRKNPPRPNQLWRKEFVDDNTFYLVSKLHPSCKITILGGNARIHSSGSLFREKKGDGEFITLIDDKTGNALIVRGASTAPDTPIIALPMSKTYQKWKYSIPTPSNTHDYFFIKSKIGFEMVMDVEHSNPKPGTPVLSYCKNDPELVHNQLWRKEPSVDGNSFYLVSKLGDNCKLTIEDDNAIIHTSGTLFKEEKSDGESVILIQSGTNQALHVDDEYSCTRIRAVTKNGSVNQKWVIKEHAAV